MTDDYRDLTSVLTQPSEDNVLPFTGSTLLDLPPALVLDAAKAANLEIVVIVGRDGDGELYAASSSSDVGMALVLFEEFKREVI